MAEVAKRPTALVLSSLQLAGQANQWCIAPREFKSHPQRDFICYGHFAEAKYAVFGTLAVGGDINVGGIRL